MKTSHLTLNYKPEDDTFYFAGFHDAWEFNIKDVRNEPCFAQGILYFSDIERNKDTIEVFNYINEKLQNKDLVEPKLLNLEQELESRLRSSGFDHTTSTNHAQIVLLKPALIFPCAIKPDNFNEIINTNKLSEGLYNNINSILNDSLTNKYHKKTFYGGSKEAKRLFEKFNCPNKILYDFRIEQAKNNVPLRNILIKQSRKNQELEKELINFNLLY